MVPPAFPRVGDCAKSETHDWSRPPGGSDGPGGSRTVFITGHEVRLFWEARLAYPNLTVGMQTTAPRCRDGGMAGPVQQAGVGFTAVRVDTAVAGDHLFPGDLARLVDGSVGQCRAIDFVRVQVDHNLIAVLDEGDRAAEGRFRADVTDNETNRAAGEARIGHQCHNNAALSAERGDARGRIEHLRHSRRAARTLVAYNDHVIVLEALGCLVERVEQTLLAFEHARLATKDIVLKPH